MISSDSRRSRSAGATAAEPHDAEPQDAQLQNAQFQDAQLQDAQPQDAQPPVPVSLDPRLWPRPYVDQPAGGPQTGPMRRMPRFTPALPAAQAAAPPAARPEAPAPSGRRPIALPAGQPAGRPPVLPPPAVSRTGRPQPVRAVIGDEIRVPFIWCEFGTCDATYTHPDALGERDLRDRALAAGWRYDALGRRACPDCAQHDPAFWTARPPTRAAAGDWRRAG